MKKIQFCTLLEQGSAEVHIKLVIDPLRQEDFRYTNEFDDNFIAFPTIGVTAPQSNLIEPML